MGANFIVIADKNAKDILEIAERTLNGRSITQTTINVDTSGVARATIIWPANNKRKLNIINQNPGSMDPIAYAKKTLPKSINLLIENKEFFTAQIPFKKQNYIEPQWKFYNPPGSVNDRGIFNSVMSRCTDHGRSTAIMPTYVSYCHEATHQLNSRIRNTFSRTGIHNAFYVGEGKYVIFRESKITLRHVCQFIPYNKRTGNYQTYFVNALKWWDNQPLYILDERTAYLNGTQAALEYESKLQGSDKIAQEFIFFAIALLQAIKHYDPNYLELRELTIFVRWQDRRTQELLQLVNEP